MSASSAGSERKGKRIAHHATAAYLVLFVLGPEGAGSSLARTLLSLEGMISSHSLRPGQFDIINCPGRRCPYSTRGHHERKDRSAVPSVFPRVPRLQLCLNRFIGAHDEET